MLNDEEGLALEYMTEWKGWDKCSWSIMEQRRDRVITDEFVCGLRSAIGDLREKSITSCVKC